MEYIYSGERRLAKRELSTWVNLRYLKEENRPFDLMIYAVRRRLPGNNFDKEQIRVQLQLLDANFDIVTVSGAMKVYFRPRILAV